MRFNLQQKTAFNKMVLEDAGVNLTITIIAKTLIYGAYGCIWQARMPDLNPAIDLVLIRAITSLS